jgi:uncharacterized membrane protein YfcA
MTSLAVYIFCLSIGASFVQRTTGFGFGIFIMTLLPFLMPTYGEATTLSGLLAMTTSSVIVYRMRHYLQWRKLVGLLSTFLVISTLCIFCLKRMDDVLLRRILGMVLILVSLYFAFFSRRIHIPTTRPYQMGAGVLAGVMGGFFGMQGPPAVLYFISTAKDKNEYMALAQTFFLCGNIAMTLVRAYNGFLTTTVGIDYLYGLGGVAIGASLGAFVFRRIPNRIFQYVVYTYIGISGFVILLTA